MGRAFFSSSKDAVLAAASGNFSTLISATPTAYNLTAAQATSYAAIDATWQAAYAAASVVTSRTRGLVIAKNDARDAMKRAASALAKYVYASATVTNEQLSDLGLSVRATPAPRPAPGTPTDFKTTLNGNGSLAMSWKCANSGNGGTMYMVYRKTGAAGEFISLGGTGERKFTDATIPAGTSQVTYSIQAIRSTAAGLAAEFVVNFGANGLMSTNAVPVKLAA